MTSIIADYEFCEPKGDTEIAIRDKMLQQTLRPGGSSPYPIAAEYPLVLAPSRPSRSLCIAPKGHKKGSRSFLAHASILPRQMTPTGLEKAKDGQQRSSVKFALVGNVVTAPEARGRGMMRALMEEVEARARTQKADAIVLWSDLADFYQKLGFTPGGKEIRMTMSVRKLDSGRVPFIWMPEGPLSDDYIVRMMELRSYGYDQPFFQIERSVAEFRELLGIPDVAVVFACPRNPAYGSVPSAKQIECFFMVGKGADMQGVIHEWGTSDMQLLMNASGAVAGNAGLEELMILLPPSLPKARMDVLAPVSIKIEEHPMAWVKILSTKTKSLVELALNEGFIWGLDSI